MDIITCINERSSVRRYKPSALLNRQIIESLVLLGMRAPSPKNRQPWKVIHVSGESKVQFVELGFQCLSKFKEAKTHYGSLEISLHAMSTASDLLFVYNPYDDLPGYHSVWEKSDLQSIGAFIEHILLGAKEKGLGSLWMNDVYFIQKETKEFLRIDHDVQAVIALGDPDDGWYPRPRKSLEEVLSFY